MFEPSFGLWSVYTTSRGVLGFVIRLVKATRCQMFDSNLYPAVGVESLERQLSLPRRRSD